MHCSTSLHSVADTRRVQQFQLALWSIVLHAYRTEKRFQNSTAHLSYSFGFATTAWILDVLLASVMVFTGLYGEWSVAVLLERLKSVLISSEVTGKSHKRANALDSSDPDLTVHCQAATSVYLV